MATDTFEGVATPVGVPEDGVLGVLPPLPPPQAARILASQHAAINVASIFMSQLLWFECLTGQITLPEEKAALLNHAFVLLFRMFFFDQYPDMAELFWMLQPILIRSRLHSIASCGAQ